MGSDVCAAERELQAVLEAESEIVFALVFGSRATGRARPDSDWDVAVFADPKLDAAQRYALRLKLIADLEPRHRVDLVLLNDAPALLAHRAVCGRVLVMRDRAAYSRFFVKTLAQSGDEAYWRNLHADARRRRLAEGRFGRP